MNEASVCDEPDCIFCKAVCPECGSNNISVSFSPTYQFKNDTLNKIDIKLSRFPLVVTCDACCDRFTAGVVDDDNDPRIYDLGMALVSLLGVKPMIFLTDGEDRGIMPVGQFKKPKAV